MTHLTTGVSALSLLARRPSIKMQFVALSLMILTVVLAIASWDWLLKNKLAAHGKLSYAALACGLAWVGVVAFSLPRSRSPKEAYICRDHMRHISVSLQMYAMENDERWPAKEWWASSETYRTRDEGYCPGVNPKGGYAMNGHLQGKVDVGGEGDTQTLLLVESPAGGKNSLAWAEADIVRRHPYSQTNVVTTDGIGRYIDNDPARQRERWTPSKLVDWAKVGIAPNSSAHADDYGPIWLLHSGVIMISAMVVAIGALFGLVFARKERKPFWRHIVAVTFIGALVLYLVYKSL